MELEGEQGHCSGQSSVDTETLLQGHRVIIVGTVELSVSLRLFSARISFNHRSWTHTHAHARVCVCVQVLSLQHRCGHHLHRSVCALCSF